MIHKELAEIFPLPPCADWRAGCPKVDGLRWKRYHPAEGGVSIGPRGSAATSSNEPATRRRRLTGPDAWFNLVFHDFSVRAVLRQIRFLPKATPPTGSGFSSLGKKRWRTFENFRTLRRSYAVHITR